MQQSHDEMPEFRRLVLIVEDHQDTRDTLEAVLEFAGFTCECVESRDDALARMTAGFLPACIIMDYLMSGMSLSQFTRLTQTSGVPIVLISAIADAGSIVNNQPGIRYFLQKPIVPDELIETVELATEAGEYTAIL
jgi:CheY-like chemotaxis protein